MLSVDCVLVAFNIFVIEHLIHSTDCWTLNSTDLHSDVLGLW